MSERDDKNNQKNPMARGWGFTIHPEKLPSTMTVEGYIEYLHCLPWLRYLLVSAEEGGKEGKLHLQGYLETNSQVSRFGSIWPDFSLGLEGDKCIGFLFARRGSLREMQDYIRHEGKHKAKGGALLQVWEHGIPHGKAQDESASDYSLLVADMLEGKSDYDLLQTYPWLYVRYYHNLVRLRELIRSDIPVQMIRQRFNAEVSV